MARLSQRIARLERDRPPQDTYRVAFSRWLRTVSDDDLDALRKVAERGGKPDGGVELAACDRFEDWARSEGWLQ